MCWSSSCPSGGDATAGDKVFYLAGYDSYQSGRLDCLNNWPGSVRIAMFQSRAEFDAIMSLGAKIWIPIKNVDQISCSGGDCDNRLQWQQGDGAFIYGSIPDSLTVPATTKACIWSGHFSSRQKMLDFHFYIV